MLSAYALRLHAVGPRLVDDVSRDVRDAVRALRASPVVSAVAVLSLTLGIGADTAIFSIVNSLLLRALPVKDPACGPRSSSGRCSTAWNRATRPRCSAPLSRWLP